MNEALRQTKTHLQELLFQHGINPRTNLGQNYLIDLNIVEYVVEQAHIGSDDVILEVGTGTGGMTAFMTYDAAHVISVELDRNMHALASAQLGDRENLTLMRQDALHNKNRFADEVLDEIRKQLGVDPRRRLKLVANLPYNVATPIVSNLVVTDLPWERMVVTIQLELGLRMQARPKSSTYGALSVWLQSQCYVKLLKRLPPSVFWPRPKVNSAIMQLVPNPRGRDTIADRPFFQDFLRRLFHQRRKMLRSVLVGMYSKQIEKQVIDDILQEMKLGEMARAEELPPKTLVELSNAIYHKVQENLSSS
ncbi:16S rRNA (adenine(1518)-N(6)/adenine(1519)-N(6))-dimethyltransferase RsmA [uncultured Rubinisphaera sp.]|uniref:16S rRNA (adenine(1518)-N(6)/adenine(1519)-N(6))- dimethyltransferase RsmA n=1 Tax=uncultured Rubinisphaera sp. TaxID=1678686 RepID=UPI0030DC3C53